ncbi:MAG: UDP-N-acetylmuramate--L-alanine ligase [Bacteroidota bacterium]|nr:UDP-N-acetylmuramate--L-alanine ligase [Candidatus Kapabacteria bacterium]MDW8220108.1 UDP-N-acetylmuramate--L-alanine ligase [Bacteroidota bacterium]
MFSKIHHIHFVGIGGIGMSGIAELLLDQGFTVSGSDMQLSDITHRLASLGARIYEGHHAENIQGAEVIVYSSAIRIHENPETLEAQRRNIPIIRRAEMLAEVTRLKYCLAVAGTHGKTTTTSMIGLMLMHGGIDPTVIVGGKLSGLGGTNARLGRGEWTVVEADEYDRSFLQLLPTIAVITNVEPEHLDIYADFQDIKHTFAQFANKVPFYGLVVVCLDNPGVMEVLPAINKKVCTYGLSPQCDVRAVDIQHSGRSSRFTLIRYGQELGAIRLHIPGIHNVRNALGAITVALELGVELDSIRNALENFTGVYRRFEIKGEQRGIMVIDDYAHHPSEVSATLDAARKAWDKRRIVCVFQPHTFTRTRDFCDEFGKSFSDADYLIVTDVYPAREAPLEGITGELLATAARRFGHRHVQYVPDKHDIPHVLHTVTREGDIVITLGAGDIWKFGDQFLQELQP